MTVARCLTLILLLSLPIRADGLPSSDGIINWWQAEGDASDCIGATGGRLRHGVGFAPGKVGDAFSFDGIDDVVSFGNTVGNFGSNDFTIEVWVQAASIARQQRILSKRVVCDLASYLDIHLGAGHGGAAGVVVAAMGQDPNRHNWSIVIAKTKVNDGLFHHVAFVRHTTNAFLYIDGTLEDSNSTPGITFISNTADLLVGRSPCIGVDGSGHFKGILDELTIYNRALSPSEVSAIFNAGSEGKAPPEPWNCDPPVITRHPTHTLANIGNPAQFNVVVEENAPVQYQWFKGGSAVPGATNAQLKFNPALLSNEGVYWVAVRNSCRTALSLSASLHVNRPPHANPSGTLPRVVAPCGVDASVVLDGTLSGDADGEPVVCLWQDRSGKSIDSGPIATAVLPVGKNPVELVVSDGLANNTSVVVIDVATPTEAIGRLLGQAHDCPLDSVRRVLLRAPLMVAHHLLEQDCPMAAAVQLRVFLRRTVDFVQPTHPALAALWTRDAKDIISAVRTCWCNSSPLQELSRTVQICDLPDDLRATLASELSAAMKCEEEGGPGTLSSHLEAFIECTGAVQSTSDPDLPLVLAESAQAVIDANVTPSDERLITQPSGTITYEFSGLEATTYIIESSYDSMNWQAIGVAQSLGQGRYGYQDLDAARFPRRYYRAVRP